MKISFVIPNYNNSDLIAKCLNSLLNQELDATHELQIIVVDDGSTRDSVDLVSDVFGDRIDLIRLPFNQGRSAARNIGANLADGDYLIFIDSDCIPTDPYFVQNYLQSIQNGGELIFGQVTTVGNTFWDRLQKTSFKNRLDNFNRGNKWAYTTQNVCINRSHFAATGGFDLAFDKYGFEDRDLFIRLLDAGLSCSYCDSAKVIHDDKITLQSVADKMFNAGLYSASVFRNKHPSSYRKTMYSKIDCTNYPYLVYFDKITWPFARLLVSSNDMWIESNLIPFRMRKLLAKIAYASSYMHGTAIEHRRMKNL